MTSRIFNTGIFITAALITGCCFVLSCENTKREIHHWTDRVILREEATNIESLLSQDGKKKAKLKAPFMQRFFADTMYTIFPNSLHCDFYDDSARLETWLDSRKGKYFESINKVYLWDSVVVINRSGDTLKCKDLWWDQNTKLFYSDNYAQYLTKDKQIFPGKGLEATQDFSRVTFKEVTGSNFKYSGSDFPK